LAILRCCLRDPAFSRFGTVPACDRKTAGQTDTQRQQKPSSSEETMQAKISETNTYCDWHWHVNGVSIWLQLIKSFYNETYTHRWGNIDDYMLTFLWSLTTAIYLPGGMIGAFSAGYLADRIGRSDTSVSDDDSKDHHGW